MSNLLVTQNGLYFDVCNQDLNYIGPLEESSKNFCLVEWVHILYAWFLTEMDLTQIHPEERDNTLAAVFSDLLQAELVVDRLPRRLVF